MRDVVDATVDPDNPENGANPNAYVYLRLFDGDVGNEIGLARSNRPEFTTRQPFCVCDFTTDGLTLEIANAGLLASDLVGIEYQIIFCTYAGHNAADGFTVDHAGEANSSALDKLASADFVGPLAAIRKRITFPPFASAGLANIYFRARVSTLWSKPVPKAEWNFENEVVVTEASLRLV